jgi:hypothetical protein|tara:strand:- start:195 stop:512 length:318 start_codon:yes stop_codon:yes gene_type:complete
MTTETKARPKMTAKEARQFDTYSERNASTVEESLECDCQPYEDVFTYGRWIAQGYQVQKGERSIRIPVIVRIREEDDNGDMVIKRSLKRSSPVFCRCQVKRIKKS